MSDRGITIRMTMLDTIKIKPHHFVDIVTALGAGKRHFEPHLCGHALHLVAEKIWANPDTILWIELGADDICQPCDHNIGGICDDVIDISYRPEAPPLKYEWNLLIDRRWCAVLELNQGDQLSVRNFCCRLKQLDQMMIREVYLEIPEWRTRERVRKLRRGMTLLLAEK